MRARFKVCAFCEFTIWLKWSVQSCMQYNVTMEPFSELSTHWGRNQMATILSTSFSNSSPYMQFVYIDSNITEICYSNGLFHRICAVFTLCTQGRNIVSSKRKMELSRKVLWQKYSRIGIDYIRWHAPNFYSFIKECVCCVPVELHAIIFIFTYL